MAIRCVMFDCFNVLIPFDTPVFFDFLKQYRGNCLPPENIFSGRGLELIKRHDLGLMSDTELFEGIRELFKLEGVSQEFFFSSFSSILRPDREMLAIRDELIRKGVGTVLVSNMNSFHLEYVTKNLPEFISGFDCRMISCEEGVAKPNPEAWIRPLDVLGLRAEECIFVDDIVSNVEVACRLGLKGWHYDVTDHLFCQNGKMEAERWKFKDFLDLLWNLGILKPR